MNSAQQIIAEVGPPTASLDSPGPLASWVGCCPGPEESAPVSRSDRSPTGNRQMRRILSPAVNAALKAKGCGLEALYRRLRPRLGHCTAIWAVAHRLCRLACKILHEGISITSTGTVPIRKQSGNELTAWFETCGEWASTFN